MQVGKQISIPYTGSHLRHRTRFTHQRGQKPLVINHNISPLYLTDKSQQTQTVELPPTASCHRGTGTAGEELMGATLLASRPDAVDLGVQEDPQMITAFGSSLSRWHRTPVLVGFL